MGLVQADGAGLFRFRQHVDFVIVDKDMGVRQVKRLLEGGAFMDPAGAVGIPARDIDAAAVAVDVHDFEEQTALAGMLKEKGVCQIEGVGAEIVAGQECEGVSGPAQRLS